jgi:hypothetical protein
MKISGRTGELSLKGSVLVDYQKWKMAGRLVRSNDREFED